MKKNSNILNIRISYITLIFLAVIVLELYIKIEYIIFLAFLSLGIFILLIGKTKIKITNVLIYVTLYLIYSFISLLWTVDIANSMEKFAVLAIVIIVYCIQIQDHYSILQYNKIKKIIFYQGVAIFLYLVFRGSFVDLRLSFIGLSSSADANTLSVWLLAPTYFSLEFIMTSKNKHKIFYLISTLLFGFIIVLSASRSGLIGYIFVILSFFTRYIIISRSAHKLIFSILIFLLIIFMGYIFSPEYFVERVFNSGWSSFGGRLPIWKSMLDTIYSNPLKIFFGFGFNSSIYYTYHGYVPHNLFLNILFEEGIIGLSLYALFVFSMLQNMLKNNSGEIIPLFITLLIVSLTLQTDTYRPLWIVYFLASITTLKHKYYEK
jgi:O-antigen ligase